MDNFSFQTLSGSSESRYTEKASKFLGYAFSVDSEIAIKDCLTKVREIHPKARHVCYAWRLGLDKHHYRVNDAGEPSGSAGRPILGQIDSAGLTNTLVIVIRYFGGTKLGIPGLIKAYKETTKAAIDQNSIITKDVLVEHKLTIDYSKVNTFNQLVSKYNISIKESSFYSDSAKYILSFPKKDEEQLSRLLKELHSQI